MITVDPRAQGQGVRSVLTVVATEAAGTPTTQLAARDHTGRPGGDDRGRRRPGRGPARPR